MLSFYRHIQSTFTIPGLSPAQLLAWTLLFLTPLTSALWAETRELIGAPSSVFVVVTGDLRGLIRECHCPHGQPGGLARRKAIFDRIRLQHPDAVFFDCGRLIAPDMDKSEAAFLIELVGELDYNQMINIDPSRPPQSVFQPLPALANLGFKAAVRNLSLEETIDDVLEAGIDGYDLLLIGDGGYVEAEVLKHGDAWLAFPGQYGEFVLLLEIIPGLNGVIKECAWEAIPSESVPPDSVFISRIDEFYAGQRTSP